MEAAKRVFQTIEFRGKWQTQVRNMLGGPFKVIDLKREILWEYMFHDGEQGVHWQLVFDVREHKVKSAAAVPTQ